MAVIDCRVVATCAIHPSEDPGRVAAAVSNVIEGAEVEAGEGALEARARGLGSLARIREAVRSGNLRAACRRGLERNAAGGSTMLYLNKQAAFARRVAICRDADESPLGPITVTLTSPDIGGVVDWLAS